MYRYKILLVLIFSMLLGNMGITGCACCCYW